LITSDALSAPSTARIKQLPIFFGHSVVHPAPPCVLSNSAVTIFTFAIWVSAVTDHDGARAAWALAQLVHFSKRLVIFRHWNAWITVHLREAQNNVSRSMEGMDRVVGTVPVDFVPTKLSLPALFRHLPRLYTERNGITSHSKGFEKRESLRVYCIWNGPCVKSCLMVLFSTCFCCGLHADC
jgi:hypothetical protein